MKQMLGREQTTTASADEIDALRTRLSKVLVPDMATSRAREQRRAESQKQIQLQKVARELVAEDNVQGRVKPTLATAKALREVNESEDRRRALRAEIDKARQVFEPRLHRSLEPIAAPVQNIVGEALDTIIGAAALAMDVDAFCERSGVETPKWAIRIVAIYEAAIGSRRALRG